MTVPKVEQLAGKVDEENSCRNPISTVTTVSSQMTSTNNVTQQKTGDKLPSKSIEFESGVFREGISPTTILEPASETGEQNDDDASHQDSEPPTKKDKQF